MAISKEKKKEICGNMVFAIDNSSSVVFVNFHGLSVSDTVTLRKELHTNDVNYVVAKKTLIKRAFTSSKVTGEIPLLEGEIAVAYGNDLIAPAREIYAFQKKYKGAIQILGGIFEGKVMQQEEMMNIATIPALKVLHAQFVNLINSPIQQFVMALDQIAKTK
ncbi:50S ribosomal protein L10 [Patescibacteria group bacterium]|nr:50S ribosomal protein L10 [Patescibacteria group bacterium]MBU1246546.1 50S ribosomal protein L10 [Patescibacteria group bacterium]MBU1519114.1 50S ribosomal protein L10 [Patescibacteria group bacterium]MBU1730131.1 50S ribosomal protein L10 [Patescibacteria group bacterium]MBU1956158.1 50S ribosomal protein L10 [Patescibacteria group bacterium]